MSSAIVTSHVALDTQGEALTSAGGGKARKSHQSNQGPEGES